MDTMFRPRGGRLLPYHEIHVPKDEFKLTKVTFGPGFHVATEWEALEMVNSRFGLSFAIVETKIPYRID